MEIRGLAPDDYFKVPRAALQPGDEVWTVKDGVVGIVPVRVLQRADDRVFVTGGLEGGGTVVTGGIRYATEGMRVLTEADPAP